MKTSFCPSLKNYSLVSRILALCFVLFLGSCQNEELYIGQNQEIGQIQQLKNWYDQNNKVELSGNWLNGITPNWQRVNKMESSKENLYEIEINNPDEIFASISISQTQTQKNGTVNANAGIDKKRSLIRLLIFEDKISGKYRTCFMNAIALENSNVDVNQIHYKKYRNFTGYVNFYQTNGQFNNGWKIEQGKITKSGKLGKQEDFTSKNSLDSKTRREVVCGYENLSFTRRYCYIVSAGPDPIDAEGANSDNTRNCFYKYFELIVPIYCYVPDTEYIEGDDPCVAEGNCPYYPDDGGGGYSDDPSGQEIVNIIFFNPLDKISNINDYLKCFDLDQSARLVIYVDQPTANSSTSWSGTFTNPNVGHTFVAIQQGNIRRVFGYYPDNAVTLTSPSEPKAFGNDEGHIFDVSLAVPINSSQLLNIIGYITNAPSTYNLNSYNCTDFAIEIGNLGGLSLSDSYGTWPGGGGSNPGQLGQNIRNMALPTNAIRQTTTANSASNSGTCN